MRTRQIPRNFSSGEMAPWLDGIVNELTQKGCLTLENFIIKKQGQATQRPGSFFVNEVKDSSKATVLVPVTIDDSNTYVLEIGDAYIRFYKNHARITYSATTTIYEVTSPWSTADLSDLRWCYVPADKAVLFADAGGDYALRKLTWASDASWVLDVAPTNAFKKIVLGTDLGNIYRTDDLVKWEAGAIDISTANAKDARTPGMLSVKHGFYFLPDIGNDKLYRSEDGELWLSIGPSTTTDPGAISENRNGTIILGGTGINDIWLSDDGGLSWQQQTAPTASGTDWQSFGYDLSTDTWFAARSTNVGAHSTDGRTWTSGPGPSITTVLDIEAKNDFWVAVGSDGKISTSTSVAGAWTTRASGTIGVNVVTSVAYGEPNGIPLWLAAYRSAIANYTCTGTLYQSLTGTVWSVVASFPSAITQVAWLRHKFYIFGTGQNYYTFDGSNITTVTEATFSTLITDAVRSVLYTEGQDSEWFDTTNHFPRGVGFHEGRIELGPTNTNPSRLWSSKVGLFSNFYQGDIASDGWNYEITGEGNVDIQWFMGNVGGLVVGTRTAEGILLGSQEEGITPLTAQFRWLSTFGSSNIQPVRVHDTIVFVQRGGEVIRGYVPSQSAYQSPDLTAFADHIASGGVLSLYHQDDPQTMVYAIRADGQIPALTFNGQQIAWTRLKTAATISGSVGSYESMAIIPTTGAEDEIWYIANRTIGAATKRYIEYFDTQKAASFSDAHYVDCGVEKTSGTTFATVGSLTHLAGEVVDALVDGSRVLNGLTVAASGTISLLPYSGTHVHAGLAYTAKLQTLRGDYGSAYGDGSGMNKRTSMLLAWVHDSSALAKFGPTSALATETISYSTSTALATEICNINFPGQWDRDNYIWCVVRDPRPFTLVAILPDSETGDR